MVTKKEPAKRDLNIIKIIVGIILGVLVGIGGTVGVVNITHTEDGETKVEIDSTYTIELPEANIFETEDGGIQVVEAPIVENIEGNQQNCPEGEEECGQGHYVYAPTGTIAEFTNYVLGGCWDVDSFYGSQCWDLGALFFMNYTNDGRTLSTCGTGAAKGAWDCKEQNAGDEFDLVYESSKIQPGDWIIFDGGDFGHVGMALSGNEDGYVSLLGQNQGGKNCPGGGSSANIIKISLKNFKGAFRPKSYIKPEPTPEPAPAVDNCKTRQVVPGDTMGKIMLDCTGKIEWGAAMNEYAGHWFSTKAVPGQSVFYGWTHGVGYGLFYGDVIEWREQ